MWDLVPWPGIELKPLHGELGVLATEPPGKSLCPSQLVQTSVLFPDSPSRQVVPLATLSSYSPFWGSSQIFPEPVRPNSPGLLAPHGDFPVAQTVRNLLAMRRPRFDPWVRKIIWSKEWQPAPIFLPVKSHGQRSLAGYSLWGRKDSDMAESLTLLLALPGSDACSQTALGSTLSGPDLQDSWAMTWWPWGQWNPESCPVSLVHFTSERETQSHVASKWRNQDLILACLMPKLVVLMLCSFYQAMWSQSGPYGGIG